MHSRAVFEFCVAIIPVMLELAVFVIKFSVCSYLYMSFVNICSILGRLWKVVLSSRARRADWWKMSRCYDV